MNKKTTVRDMEPKMLVIVVGVIALVAGVPIGWYIGGMQSAAQITELNDRIDDLIEEIDELNGTVPEVKPPIRVVRAQTSVNFIDYNRQKQFLILEEMGYTVDVSYVDVTASIAALVAGEADAISTTCMEYLPAIAAGEEIVQVMPYSTRGYLIVTDSDINSVADMEGKVIGASSYTSISYIYMKYVLEDAGLSVDDVTWNMVGGSSSRRAALAAGSIDAGLLYAEYALILEKQPGLHILGPLTDYLASGEVFSGAGLRKDFMDTYPQATRDFVKAGVLANVFCLTQRDAYIEEARLWVNAEVGIEDQINESFAETLYDGYRSWNVWTLDFLPENAERALEISLEVETITETIPVADWNNFAIWNSILEELYIDY
jgi:ABC-type nitrate/sulfonate/bicarbonate transport system substrate-binding protein